ncbi:MAG: nicotinamide-nucleotide amidohydrolase family protein, partial [Acidobacteria bacterium]|nr:nicotinamide-nucleotide amidohydrolase family protein [Acidobacteriota bacterium]
GSSDYVDRSVVAYSNAAKAGLLGVPEPLLARHGAVSEPVARAMAEGLLVRSGADVVVAITGIAGPGGGSADKPVGTVWFAVAIAGPRDTQALVCRFIGGRELVKTFAAVTALDLVRRRLLDAPWDIDWARR